MEDELGYAWTSRYTGRSHRQSRSTEQLMSTQKGDLQKASPVAQEGHKGKQRPQQQRGGVSPTLLGCAKRLSSWGLAAAAVVGDCSGLDTRRCCTCSSRAAAALQPALRHGRRLPSVSNTCLPWLGRLLLLLLGQVGTTRLGGG